ncbi:LPXTG cell wall anchor domain-containing protein [Enterococcus ratti]|uniref:LPXTG cell wall anchor domain-containing protein n=1 Tax=Enterococcus ratti TaxID=150033 RepID=UPI003516D8D9
MHFKLCITSIAFCLICIPLSTAADTAQEASTSITVTFIRRITSEHLPGGGNNQCTPQENTKHITIIPKKEQSELPKTGDAVNYLATSLGSSALTFGLLGILKHRKEDTYNEQS